MKVTGDYQADGYVKISPLVPPEVATAFLHRLQCDISQSRVSLDLYSRQSPLLTKGSIEIGSLSYKPMLTFLWAMTPIISQLTGKDLLPTYNYFRIYRSGDICRVHSDRPASEHAVSLTLAYSDGKSWDLEIGAEPLRETHPPADQWSEKYHSISMDPGDAVLYRGVRHRHARVKPNPNRWSAHMFLFWVDRDGPHKDMAFDREKIPKTVEFDLT